MPTKTMLDHALEYARAGLRVIPLHSVLDDGSCTCGAAQGRCSPGKHPRIENWRDQATTDEEQIRKWWSDRRWPNASIGGVCGEFLCLDIDARHDGFDTLQRLIQANTELPADAVVLTGEYDGQRSLHYWYRVPPDRSPATRANVREGIDIRGCGGYAVMPPSPHPSGVRYEWETGSIEDAVEAPEWVLDIAKEYVEGDSTWAPDPNFRMSKQVKDFLAGKIEIEPGQQRDFLVATARSVLTTGRDVETATQLLWEGYDGEGGIQNCQWDPSERPWMEEDIYQIVSDIYKKPPTTPMEKDFTADESSFDDMGNGHRLIASFPEGHVFHIHESDRWYVWSPDTQRFIEDNGTWMRQRWEQVVSELAKSATGVLDESRMRSILNHVKSSRMKPRVDAALSMASYRAGVARRQSEVNNDPFLFACANGVIDLRDGSIRDQEPGDLIIRYSDVEFDPSAKSKLWDAFLKRSVPDQELRDFLQLACGYSLSGITDEHAFFYVHGRPASGKTTMLEVLKHVMGSYALTADTSTFMRESRRSAGGPSEDIARLANARLVITHEIEQGDRLAVGLVSRLVGGDTMTARFLQQQSFSFKPQFKLWIGANHLPRITGGPRSGIWRRMKIISFDEPIAKEDRDPALPRKLREPEAAAAVLAWAIEGATRWYEGFREHRSLAEPESVERHVAELKRESDHVEAFAQDALEQTEDRRDRVAVGGVFKHYLKWCDAEGRDRRETQHALSRKLTDLGFNAKQAQLDGKSQRCWIGVQLLDIAGGESGIKVKGARKGARKKGSK